MARPVTKAYTQSDIGLVLSQSGCNSFDSCIRYLREHGTELKGLTSDQVQQMIKDFEDLNNRGVPFSSDPGILFNELQRIRT